jgi:IS30 family transposase
MSHLTREQRYTISQMKQNGEGPTAIAEMIGKNKSTVSRELLRNCDKRSGIYDYDLAQRKYEKRQAEKPKHKRLLCEVFHFVGVYVVQFHCGSSTVAVPLRLRTTTPSPFSLLNSFLK